MMKTERNYDFRKRLLQVHRKDLRDAAILPAANELVLTDGWQIVLPENPDLVTETAARDFADYLLTSMNLAAMVCRDAISDSKRIILQINPDLGNHSVTRGYRITVDEEILVEGFDGKGIAQGLYYLEDVMNLRLAPYLPKGTTAHHPLLAIRKTMSGYGADLYPDDYLNRLAHIGITAISLWVYGNNETKTGFVDFNELAYRASKYGLDIYVQFFSHHSMHPDDPGAQAFYDDMYGKLFHQFPFIKGLTIVGEACQFSSRDPRVGLSPSSKNSVEGIPTGKVAPGWWPCTDWPDLIRMIQKSVLKFRPDADIVLCSYNWGWAPEADRLKLIENLPDGIALLATWEMFEEYEIDGTISRIADYSIRMPGPGKYFASEAAAAAARGLRVYSIFNGTGRTWDFGAVPYMPAPYQWIQRYENMRKAHVDWNVQGVNEAHHYGVYPSFITDLEKWAFTDPDIDLQDTLRKILASYFGRQNVEVVDKAMQLWSQAFTYITPTGDDQYGAYRVGPSYPFWMTTTGALPPQNKFAMHKASSMYRPYYRGSSYGSAIVPRTQAEIRSLERFSQLLLEGLQLLETIESPNEELARLINMGWFIYRSNITGIHSKQFFLLKRRLDQAENDSQKHAILDEIIVLLKEERDNAEQAIPLVEADSVLGYEPSMEYTTDKEHILWKLRQMDYVINGYIPEVRKSMPGYQTTNDNR